VRARLAVLVLAVVAGAGVLPAAKGADLQIWLFCDNDKGTAAVPSMEATYIDNPGPNGDGCWAHMGAHQYFPGVDTIYALRRGEGEVFAVEQQFSPPIEVGAITTGTLHVYTPIVIEISRDGKGWQTVGVAEYHFLGIPGGLNERQLLHFAFLGDGQEFRFLRIREPLSAAQGLSGYLDFSQITLDVDIVGPADPLPTQPQVDDLRTCATDILEDIYPGHPCHFGGLDRWDAPSWTHTYYLDNAQLDRIKGAAILHYFRPDDPGTCCGQTVQGILDGSALVQTSLDGVAWDTVGTFPVTYNVPATFDVGGLDHKPAAFVRIISAKHPGWANHPALKHAEAFLLFSALQLSGELP
jgi:hypothetical protein